MGISKLLLERCLEKAKELRVVKVILFSNSQLKAALALYEKYGFQHVPVKDSPFATADLKMELIIQVYMQWRLPSILQDLPISCGDQSELAYIKSRSICIRSAMCFQL